jgi:fermentation-respiration switch protein FrsA (DUF1100 family)
MKNSWDYWARLGFTYVVRAAAALTVLMVLFSSVEVYNVLRPPRRVSSGTVLQRWNIKYQSVDLVTEDGIRLSAWYTPPRNGAVILVAHSYGDHRPEWIYQMLARKGYGVLAWDARAQGKSDGDITTIGYSEVLDVKAALKYALAQPGIEHVGAWGGSMGGATMIRATAQLPEIEALFVDSSFASLSEEFDFLIPYPMMSPIAKVVMEMETGININDVDPRNEIAKISPRPVFIAQGIADTAAPPDSAEELFNAAGKPRYLWTEAGIPHLGLYFNNPRRYQRRLIDFFDTWLLKT